MQSPPRLKFILAAGVLLLALALALRTRTGNAPDPAQEKARQEIAALESALAMQPGNMTLRRHLAEVYAKNQRQPDALRVVAEGCNLNSSDVQCWMSLGDLQTQADQLRAAAKSYEKALELVPGSSAVLGALAQIEIKRGRERRARQLLDRAAKTGEHQGMIHFVRAQLLMRTAPPAPVIAELKNALRREPDLLPAWLMLARFSAQQNQIADMEAACRGALKIAPGNPDALCVLARAKLQGPTPEAAKKLATEALTRAPQSAAANSILGLLALREGNAEVAIGHLESALVANGSDIEVRANLAKAYRRAGRTEEADKQTKILQSEVEFGDRIRQLLTQSKMNPNDAKLRVAAGDLYATAGAKEKAAAQYEAALEIDPNLATARQGLKNVGGDGE